MKNKKTKLQLLIAAALSLTLAATSVWISAGMLAKPAYTSITATLNTPEVFTLSYVERNGIFYYADKDKLVHIDSGEEGDPEYDSAYLAVTGLKDFLIAELNPLLYPSATPGPTGRNPSSEFPEVDGYILLEQLAYAGKGSAGIWSAMCSFYNFPWLYSFSVIMDSGTLQPYYLLIDAEFPYFDDDYYKENFADFGIAAFTQALGLKPGDLTQNQSLRNKLENYPEQYLPSAIFIEQWRTGRCRVSACYSFQLDGQEACIIKYSDRTSGNEVIFVMSETILSSYGLL